MEGSKIIYQLSCNSDEFAKFCDVDGSGRFDASYLLAEYMTEKEENYIRDAGQIIADVIKNAIIRKVEENYKECRICGKKYEDEEDDICYECYSEYFGVELER